MDEVCWVLYWTLLLGLPSICSFTVKCVTALCERHQWQCAAAAAGPGEEGGTTFLQKGQKSQTPAIQHVLDWILKSASSSTGLILVCISMFLTHYKQMKTLLQVRTFGLQLNTTWPQHCIQKKQQHLRWTHCSWLLLKCWIWSGLFITKQIRIEDYQ